MPKIESEGNYNVRIEQATFQEQNRKDDAGAFRVGLKGITPDGFEAWGELDYSNYEFQSGKYEGKTTADKSADILAQLGVKDGYIGNLQESIDKGLEAVFVLKWDEWTNKEGETKRTLKVAFINPPRKTQDIKNVDFGAMIAKLKGEPSKNVSDTPVPRKAEVVEETPSDLKPVQQAEIPF